MPRPFILKSLFAMFPCALVYGAGLVNPVDPTVTVHEWGTFTSVAGQHGESVTWAPILASSDLPCFVHQYSPDAKYLPGLVRMETPVDYFYTSAPTKVSVHVGFPQGKITEWYPKATLPKNAGTIDWADLNIMPGSNLKFPSSTGDSRYYAARATDSAPVQAGDESEKLLFYRGMGDFIVPVQPSYEKDGVRIRVSESAALPLAIYFENQGGRIGYRMVRDVRDAVVEKPALDGSLAKLRSDLTAALVQSGLYEKEATAMLETWHDSWFEEGARVIYLMPRATVDQVLPLQVTPQPRETQRVFVGRVEMLSPATEARIQSALAVHDKPALEKMGRFLQPFILDMKARGVLAQPEYAQSVAGRFGLDAPKCIP